MADFEDDHHQDDEIIDRLVHINRVAKVVKGGRRFGFAALVVAGDQSGRAGFGHGKAREVPEAIRKATHAAKASMVHVPLRDGRTLHHEVLGRHGAGRVILRPAQPGRGIISGGAMRPIFEALGVQDIVSKSLGSTNPYNIVRATFDALKKQANPQQIARRRGKSLGEVNAARALALDKQKSQPAHIDSATAKNSKKAKDSEATKDSEAIKDSKPAKDSKATKDSEKAKDSKATKSQKTDGKEKKNNVKAKK